MYGKKTKQIKEQIENINLAIRCITLVLRTFTRMTYKDTNMYTHNR